MTGEAKLTALRPHLVKAYLNWVSENCTRPHITFVITDKVMFNPWPKLKFDRNLVPVIANDPQTGQQMVTYPNREFDTLTLNVGELAVTGYSETDEGLLFNCRFNGKVSEVYIPYDAIYTVTSPDVKIGNMIPLDSHTLFAIETPVKKEGPTPKSRPSLTVVK